MQTKWLIGQYVGDSGTEVLCFLIENKIIKKKIMSSLNNS